jgi:hypothetical protein
MKSEEGFREEPTWIGNTQGEPTWIKNREELTWTEWQKKEPIFGVGLKGRTNLE